MVENQRGIDMTDKDAYSRMEPLLASYQSLLHHNGLSWLMKDKERISVYYVLPAICLESLRARSESNLEMSQYGLRNFMGFMAYAIKLSETFQLFGNGVPSKRRKNRKHMTKETKTMLPTLRRAAMFLLAKEIVTVGIYLSVFMVRIRLKTIVNT